MPIPQNPATPPTPSDPNEQTPEQIRQAAQGGSPPQPSPQPQPPQAPPAAQPPAQAPPAQQPPATPPAPGAVPRPIQQPDGKFAIIMPSGQRYIGDSPEATYDQVIQAQVSATRTIRDITGERDRFRAAAQTLSGGQPVDPQSGQPKQQFEKGVFQSLQEQDPMTAQLYLLQHLFEFDSIEEVIPALTDMRYQTRDYAYNMAINQFRAQAPDFPGTEDAVNKVMQTMQARNLQFTADNLKLVHDGLKNQPHGYAPLPMQQAPQPPQAPPYNPYAAPPQPPQLAYNPNPQGMYGYEPGRGFGPSSVPMAAQQPPNPYPPPPPGYGYAPLPPNPYLPANVQPPSYPAIPAVSTPPLPTAPTGGPPMPGQFVDENALYSMDKNALREQLERSLLTR